jgi:HSP20 family protein
MYNITKKNYDSFDKMLNSFFNDPFFYTTSTSDFKTSKLGVEVLEDKAVIALSVIGHDKSDITIELHEDVIYVKSNEKELSPVEKQLISKVNERITVGENFDGENAEAKIVNGILYLTIPKKEVAKPKKVTIKVG